MASFFTILIFKNLLKMTKEKVLIFFWLILPIFLSWIISIFVPVYSYFRFIFVLPAFYLLVIRGVQLIKSRKLQVVTAIGVFLVGFSFQFYFLMNSRFYREDWRKAVSWVEEESKSVNSAAIFVTNSQIAPYQFYAHLTPFYGPDGWQEKNLQRIFLFRYVQPIFDPEDVLRKEIEETGYRKISEKDFNGVVVWTYKL